MRLPFGMRWWELVPEAVLAIGLGVFLVTEPDAATSAFGSTTATTLMVVTALGWLVVRLAGSRLGRRWAVPRTGAFGLGTVAILLVVVVPAYDDTTVVEALPRDVAVSEASPTTLPAEDAPATTIAVPAGPRVVADAMLHGIDHRASGRVRFYEQPDGALVVGLEEIDIQPGPDYDVYLVPGADRDDIDGGTRLDDLRGNKGTQYYEVRQDLDLAADAWTVLVWCQTFDVPVAAATPT
jgi:hypothetical protein